MGTSCAYAQAAPYLELLGRMTTRAIYILALPLVLSACATAVTESDYSLQWKKDSVRLVVVDDEGKPVSAFGGKNIGVPGYLMTGDEIAFHPGVKRIRHICPRSPGSIEVLDIAPSVSFEFKAGHKYELSCRAGQPHIRELQ
jgi:hypothetical protein